MIKPIELFPGALIQSKDKLPGIMEVLAVGHEKIVASSKYFYEEEYFLEEVKPIPITKEIAKKLGFRKKRGASHMWEYYQRGAIEIWFKGKRVDSIWWNTTILLTHQKKICVHRLQRALLEKTRVKIDFNRLL